MEREHPARKNFSANTTVGTDVRQRRCHHPRERIDQAGHLKSQLIRLQTQMVLTVALRSPHRIKPSVPSIDDAVEISTLVAVNSAVLADRKRTERRR